VRWRKSLNIVGVASWPVQSDNEHAFDDDENLQLQFDIISKGLVLPRLKKWMERPVAIVTGVHRLIILNNVLQKKEIRHVCEQQWYFGAI
jgi:hypothetical protein